MRVLVVGPGWVDSSEMGCVRGLRALGHEAEICDLQQHIGLPGPLRRSALAFRVAEFVLKATVREPFYLAQRHLLDQAIRMRADLVLAVQLVWVLPETVVELRRRGIRCVGWFPDAFTSFGRGTFLLAPWDALFYILAQTIGSQTIAYHFRGTADVTAVRMLGIQRNDYPVDEGGTISRMALASTAATMIPGLRVGY